MWPVWQLSKQSIDQTLSSDTFLSKNVEILYKQSTLLVQRSRKCISRPWQPWCFLMLVIEDKALDAARSCANYTDGETLAHRVLMISEWDDRKEVFTTPWWSGVKSIVRISSFFIDVFIGIKTREETNKGKTEGSTSWAAPPGEHITAHLHVVNNLRRQNEKPD